MEQIRNEKSETEAVIEKVKNIFKIPEEYGLRGPARSLIGSYFCGKVTLSELGDTLDTWLEDFDGEY